MTDKTLILWQVKRWVFYLLRGRQPVFLADDEQAATGRRLRVLQVGDPSRARDFLERLYGKPPQTTQCGHVFMVPSANRLTLPSLERNLEMIDINRLYLERFRRRGYFAIPQWIEFGCPVVRDAEKRYAGGDQWLRQRIRGVRESELVPRISRSTDDFEFFYREMYRPYTESRFGDTSITKSAAKLRRDFRAGFVLLLERDGRPVAGGLTRIDASNACLRAIAAVGGDESLLRLDISAALDYHLHEWAAENDIEFIDVGHTRPFPADGVFFNKRKWLMSIRPDADGVMNMALRWRRGDRETMEALANYSFVFQTREGLGVFLIQEVDHPLDFDELSKMRRRNWTTGLSSLIAVCPGGLREGVRDRARETWGESLQLCPDLDSARDVHRRLS